MMKDNLNHKGFGIMDTSGNQVAAAAAAAFAYRGFIISMSQVFSNTPDIVVFADKDEYSAVLYNANSVQDACEWCNEQLTGFR